MSAGRAGKGHVFLVTTIVTFQFSADSVVGQAYIATLAYGNMIAIITDNIMGESPSVLKKNNLLLCSKSLLNGLYQLGSKMRDHLLSLGGDLCVGQDHLRRLYITKT